MSRSRVWMVCLALVVYLAAAPARAEVTVSITISGPVEELVPILQKLQELGLGAAVATADPLKLNVHSVMTGTEQPAGPAPAAADAQPAFESATVEPALAKLGDKVLITAKVIDPNHAIDTVAASIGDIKLKVDLFDNGTEGDVTAGDGIWSRQTVLLGVAVGEAAIAVNAYNANGEAVQVPGPDGQPAPLTAQAKVTVTP